MFYLKVNDTLYPAVFAGTIVDADWDGRESKTITVEMDYTTANELFVDGLKWSIVEQNDGPEWDNSEYCVAGDLIDHRDGTITAKMGKLTDLEEAYELLLGGEL